MAKYQTFGQLPVWQEAAALYNAVLDLLEQRSLPLSRSFQDQLNRAALSVSNNIAEGFERLTTAELISFISIARGSSGEVRSMIMVIQKRPNLRPHCPQLSKILAHAESCTKQLVAWTTSIESLDFKGKRQLTSTQRLARDAAKAAKDFRTNFLRNLKPTHPLYNSPEARTARGEPEIN
jgi:four helix bundle protein